MNDRLQALTDQGVSIWLDDISRQRLTTGNLAELVEKRHVVGVTSNPTIFAKALSDADDYNEQVKDLAVRGVDLEEAVRAITTYDVRWACDVLREAYDRTDGQDGRVSIEVDPRLAHRTDATIAEARALWWLVDRSNVMIKIPATQEGLAAITAATSEGISVNVTLIFSLERYRAVMDAYLTGLEQAHSKGVDLSSIRSVASFFVSRIDTEVDKRLDALADTEHADEAKALRSKAAVANARLAYREFQEVFSSERWSPLENAGAHKQRPLWASTSVKDPNLPDTMYVVELVAPDTVNTMPEATIEATADHGEIDRRPGDDELRRRPAGSRPAGEDRRLVRRRGPGGRGRRRRQVREVLAGASRHGPNGTGEGTRMKVDVTVRTSSSYDDAVAQLVSDRVASRIAAQDPTLWGPDAESEAAVRLSWVALPTSSRPLLAEIDALRADLWAEGLDQVVLCGMGGSSLAPEVVARTFDIPLTILDSTNPSVIHRVVSGDLSRTVVVVSSKSGGTLETDSQRRALAAAFEAAGIDAASRMVVVTDPGSDLEKLARAEGYRKVFLADPHVGGRYSALTAFGLVPTGLAGIDISDLLDEAEAVMSTLATDSPDNPALVLAAALAANAGRDKVAIADLGSGIRGFADWAEQLIAESTGKHGMGVLPIAVEGASAPEVRWPAHDVVVAGLTDPEEPGRRRPGRRAVGHGLRAARRAAPALGDGDGGRRTHARDQPLRPARRREREEGRPRPARRSSRRRSRLRSAKDGIEARGSDGLLDGVDSIAGAIEALLVPSRRRRLPRRHGLPRLGARCRPPRDPGGPGSPYRTTDDVRLGTTVPALDGPVPQGRSALRASSCRSRRPSPRTSRSRTGRSPSAR